MIQVAPVVVSLLQGSLDIDTLTLNQGLF